MTEEVISKKVKSFSLKVDNIEKIERIAYEEKKKQSMVVDEMVEDFEDGNS